ncbi:MAG: FHA domain-containing protein [Chloroflexota bacterium]
MDFSTDRLELCVTYVAESIELGVRPTSIEFIDRNGSKETATLEGHIRLESGTSFYMSSNEFGIGRSVNNDLFIDSPQISRSHAKIIARGDESFVLSDSGSANGTSLNGHRLDKEAEYKLQESGEIQLAGVFHMKFTDYGATHVAADTITLYGITLSHPDRRVWVQGDEEGESIRLSSSEHKFLSALMEKYPEHVSHRDLTYNIWGWEPDNSDDDKRSRDALFNIVKRLRERLFEVDPDNEYIETVRKWGSREGGYKFNKQ